MRINKTKFDIAMANNQFSAEDLAKISGISRTSITRITKGVQQARPATLGKIAKALDVKVEELIEQ